MLTNNYLRGGAVQWMEDRCPQYVEKPIPVLELIKECRSVEEFNQRMRERNVRA
jgi:hypothetical protein